MASPTPPPVPAEQKALRERCALALGWKRCAEPECDGWCSPEFDLNEFGDHWSLPPYGEDTPEGWACTGPLQSRFCLDVCQTIHGEWGAFNYGRKVYAKTPCAAIAEWVAQFGAALPAQHGGEEERC